MSHIIIYTAGTLGDHLPYIALGQALRARGHQVTMVINQAMHRYAERADLPAVALTDVDRGPEEARQFAHAWNHWQSPEPDAPQAPPFTVEQHTTQASELIEICQGADLLLSTAIRTLGWVAHAALNIPWMTLSMNPVAFWQPHTAEDIRLRQQAREREYALLKEIIGQTLVNLGIDTPVPPHGEGWLLARHVLLASSQYFSLPNLNQLQPHASLDLTGFWHYRDPDWAGWQPDEALRRFCQRRPIVLAFSSQPLEEPQRILAMHAEAAARLGLPLLVQRGWANFSDEMLPGSVNRNDIFFADFLPHDWLFAQAACAIQHGGIGSIAQALRQGCPLLIEPFGNDQLYNASRVDGLGVGAAMHPLKMTVDGLTRNLVERVLAPGYRRRAEAIGQKLREEDGLATACQLIERYLARLEPGADRHPAVYSHFTPPLTPRRQLPDVTSLENWFKALPPADSNRPPLHTGSPRDTIPKIIHQTWKDEAVPPQLRHFQQSWQRHHPDWRYVLWTDADNRALLARHYAWFLPIYDSYPEPIMRADAARYFILHRYGGVYADLDFECLRPLEPLLENRQLVFGLEPDEHLAVHFSAARPFAQIVCNAWLASIPEHPFWPHLFQQMVAYHPLAEPMHASGPFLLTRAVESYPGAAGISLEPAARLYPITAEQSRQRVLADPAQRAQLLRDAFAVHHWHSTWWRESLTTRRRQRAVTVLDAGQPGAIVPMSETSLPSEPAPPRVSCLMITRDRPALARRAVHCFQQQSYPNRELIVVDDGLDDSLAGWVAGLGDDSIRVIRLPDQGQTLGELRNLAVARATGDYIAQWDDDDLSHWQRLEIQMGVLLASGAAACFLEREQLWWPQQQRFALSNRRAWEGSLICARVSLPPYPAQRQGEDTPVVEQILGSQRVALLDYPQLYTYVYHGDNTFAAGHWDSLWAAATRRYREPLAEALFVNLQNDIRLALPEPPAAALSPPPAIEPAETQRIPKIIHQTWSTVHLPADLATWQRGWREHHPDWNYYLWTDDDLRRFIAHHYGWFLPIYDSYPQHIMRVDAARCFILYHFGGLYVDLDFECVRPSEPLLAGRELAFGLEPPSHLDLHLPRERSLEQIVCNAWMASTPGHPFWEHVFKKLVEYHHMPGPLDATGPFMLTRAVESYPQRERIAIISHQALYPVSNQKPWGDYSPQEQAEVLAQAFALHHWRGTWWKNVAQITPAAEITPQPEATVLILVPVKDAASYLPRFFENVRQFSYPHRLISLAFLESDSRDDTYAQIVAKLPALQREFAAARLFKQDYGLQLAGRRWEPGVQYRRRSVLAKSRNQLLARALADEQWVLWLDVDVARWPANVIEQLLAAQKYIVAPNCLSEKTGDTFDYNTFQLTPDAPLLDWPPYLIDGILQPPQGFGRRYLNELRQHSLVQLDGVGGAMLLVNADLHREGLVFPTFAYKHHIETEGLALLARDMGYRCWGLPNLEIFHP